MQQPSRLHDLKKIIGFTNNWKDDFETEKKFLLQNFSSQMSLARALRNNKSDWLKCFSFDMICSNLQSILI